MDAGDTMANVEKYAEGARWGRLLYLHRYGGSLHPAGDVLLLAVQADKGIEKPLNINRHIMNRYGRHDSKHFSVAG